MPARPQTSEKKSLPAVTIATRPDSYSKPNVNIGNTEALTTLKSVSNTKIGSASDVTVRSEVNRISPKADAIETKTKGAGDEVLNAAKVEDIFDKVTEEPEKTGIESEPNVTTEKLETKALGRVNLESKDRTNDSDIKIEKPKLEVLIVEEEMSTNTQNIRSSEPDLDRMKTDKESEVKVDDTQLNMSVELNKDDVDGELKKHFTNVEPNICLCSSVKTKKMMERFGVKLRNAGYGNIVKDVGTELGDNVSTGAKVVVVCLDSFQDSVDTKLMDQVNHYLSFYVFVNKIGSLLSTQGCNISNCKI